MGIEVPGVRVHQSEKVGACGSAQVVRVSVYTTVGSWRGDTHLAPACGEECWVLGSQSLVWG